MTHTTRNQLTILVIHGPNLNLLGQRETGIYGAMTLADIDRACQRKAAELGVTVESFQSNHEGGLVERIQAAMGRIDWIIINPAAYTHTSVAIRDALLAVNIPVIEVHLSNVHRRESFRHHSYVSDIAVGVITGLGADGYLYALEAATARLSARGEP
ncbi:MAG: type II 3-dehydroquinate dehydratase [Magnetococcales bacterium]|nr:type II 3-dehydroquinate dehydratase [Magnetococcales bacterium]NGZ05531.1 type II 3-dehydroquinate dehydratase [Magnetococcales bacterium]